MKKTKKFLTHTGAHIGIIVENLDKDTLGIALTWSSKPTRFETATRQIPIEPSHVLGTDYVVQTKPSDHDKWHPNHVYNRQIELLAESAVGGQKSKSGPKCCYKDGKKSLP